MLKQQPTNKWMYAISSALLRVDEIEFIDLIYMRDWFQCDN